jgi:hypothetical protein
MLPVNTTFSQSTGDGSLYLCTNIAYDKSVTGSYQTGVDSERNADQTASPGYEESERETIRLFRGVEPLAICGARNKQQPVCMWNTFFAALS